MGWERDRCRRSHQTTYIVSTSNSSRGKDISCPIECTLISPSRHWRGSEFHPIAVFRLSCDQGCLEALKVLRWLREKSRGKPVAAPYGSGTVTGPNQHTGCVQTPPASQRQRGGHQPGARSFVQVRAAVLEETKQGEGVGVAATVPQQPVPAVGTNESSDPATISAWEPLTARGVSGVHAECVDI